MNPRIVYLDDYGNPLFDNRVNDRWVNPSRTRTKSEYPYSYDEFFLIGNRETINGDGINAVYSDRLYQWDKTKYDAAHAAVGKRFDQMTSKNINKFMSTYLDKKVEVVALAEGCNASSGYPYFIIWYREKA